MTPSPWTPSDGLFRRTITAPNDPRVIPLVKFRPKDSFDIPIFLEEYMKSRQGTEQSYRCSKAIEEKFRDMVTPVKYDNPLNDFIPHIPFFRRSEVFPLFLGTGFGPSPSAKNKIRKWLSKRKYLDMWDGMVSKVPNSENWIPTTLLHCRRCQDKRVPCVYTSPAPVTSIRNIVPTTNNIDHVHGSLPSKPDTAPLSDQTFDPVASGELSTCLGCKYDGDNATCTFNLVNCDDVRVRPLLYPRARVVTLVGPDGETVPWHERHKHQINNWQDLVQPDPDSVAKMEAQKNVQSQIGSIVSAGHKRSRSQSPVIPAKRKRYAFGSKVQNDVVATLKTLDIDEATGLDQSAFKRRLRLTALLNRPAECIQPLWADQTRLVDISKPKDWARLPKAGPLDWDMKPTEIITRLLSVDLEAGPVDTRLLSSPLLEVMAGQLDLDTPFVPFTSPYFADHRARYLALSSDTYLTRWLTADDSPHEAVIGLLQSYATPGGREAKATLVIPTILWVDFTSDVDLQGQIAESVKAVVKNRAATNAVGSTGTAMKPISRVMGIIRRFDTYYAFTISLEPYENKAIIFDPFPESSLNSGTRSLLEAIARACGSRGQVECVYDENIDLNSKGTSDKVKPTALTSSQSASLALLLISGLSGTPSAGGLSGMPRHLGYGSKSFPWARWMGNLEGRLLHLHVNRVARIWGIARLLQEEFTSS